MENVDSGIKLSGICNYVIKQVSYPVEIEALYEFEGDELPSNQFYNIHRSVTRLNQKNKTIDIQANVSISL